MNNESKSPARRGPAYPARRQPQPGDVLDGTYRIDRVLGYGGVGVVCAAWHLHVQRPCAVKFLHPQLVGNPELRARFRREAQSAFQLGHPHIVSITDFRDDLTGWPYIVMELVVGETLRSRLERGPLPPRLSVRLMAELCDALCTAHRRGVIHRDLKPENLFLVHQTGGQGDDDLFLKVLDFGLSKILDESDITENGRLLGSPSYMSPEQARGESHLVDARSDIFAVGGLLYECLTAYKLFEAQSFEHKRQLIMEARLPPLKLVQRGLPVMLEAIIRRCCARLPEDRYQTADELAAALGVVYGEEPAPQRASTAPGMPRPPSLPAPGAVADGEQSGFEPTLPANHPPMAPPGLVSDAPVHPPSDSASPTSIQQGEVVDSLSTRTVRHRPVTWALVLASGVALGGLGALISYRYLRPAGPPILVQPMLSPDPAKPPVPQWGPDERGATRGPAQKRAERIEPRPSVSGGGQERHGDKRDQARPAGESQEKLDQLTMVAVNPVMLGAAQSIARCFPEGSEVPRRLRVDMVIAPTGRVREATTEISDQQQAGCVVDRLLRLHFPAFHGEAASVQYEFVNLRR